MDIAAFLTTRLDEAEQTAREAAVASCSEHWRADDNALYGTDDVSNNPGPFIAPYNDYLADAVGAHIAYWDPARVLAEVAAKRRILNRHSRCGSGIGWCDDGGHALDWSAARCFELADLASVYSDHPDYDPAWRVE